MRVSHSIADFGRSTRKDEHGILAISSVEIIGRDVLTALDWAGENGLGV
jgi:hypothetical protein